MIFGGSFDLAILSGPLALAGHYIGQSGFGGLVMRLPVLAGQVLPDRHHRQLGVFWSARTIGRHFIVA
ncbi:MAG: hypothetical protein GDA36_01340 [Rhodobacteraceae bacterium]|nr:hypothetical protein [Paracoccaceae bacterium]